MDMMMMVGPLFAVIGAIMLALQKKRKLNPIVSAEEAGGHVISGGAIMLCGIGIYLYFDSCNIQKKIKKTESASVYREDFPLVYRR